MGRLLAKVLDMNAMELGADLSGTGQYVILKKDVTPQVKRQHSSRCTWAVLSGVS